MEKIKFEKKNDKPENVAKFIKAFQLKCQRDEHVLLTPFCREYKVSFDLACVLVDNSIIKKISRGRYMYTSPKQPSLDMAKEVLEGLTVRRKLKKLEKDTKLKKDSQEQEKVNEEVGKILFPEDQKDKRIKELEIEVSKKDKELFIKNNELSILSYQPILKKKIGELINEYNQKCPTNKISGFHLTMESGESN